ncbi:F-box protein [Thalictrum thalictroides]|uniref:F-box protein n=1 Tax=Thalictrum thalictroides TaxID=46969 RepID=A0A7J6XCP4_THATH|nr:F-box protein [Thalictrum thalictroides]
MGCCGEDDDDIFTPLSPNSLPLIRNPSDQFVNTMAGINTNGDDVISPMNSNFYALICSDILRTIFKRLPIQDLARASCVCRIWNSVASDREIQTSAFKSPWKLKDVIGNPSSTSFWRDNSLNRFAISHRLLRGDTVTSLAVKYSAQVVDIKRLNNMMSDHGIYSRERLLIPVSKPEMLLNGTCYVELDAHAKREVAVLYPDGCPVGHFGYLSGRTTTNKGKRVVIDSMKRSMRVDDGTAEYYWSISNGDPRAAFSELSDDLRWEQQTRLI